MLEGLRSQECIGTFSVYRGWRYWCKLGCPESSLNLGSEPQTHRCAHLSERDSGSAPPYVHVTPMHAQHALLPLPHTWACVPVQLAKCPVYTALSHLYYMPHMDTM